MGDKVYLKIRTFQGGLNTHKLKKLKPRYTELYLSVERIGAVACSCFNRSVSNFHDVVHASALRKVDGEQKLFLHQLSSDLDRNLFASCQPLEILDCQVKEIQECRPWHPISLGERWDSGG